ncbi:DUF6417 family protein [Streptomyces sp. NPDC091281]|uniref:DUF6417 family protein n=1 Tax=Streptomyces sp. NPDC091281 TaxID=3365985 RepID=UPI003828A8DB
MSERTERVDTLSALRERESAAEHGWVLGEECAPPFRLAVEAAAAKGLVELADQAVREELSARGPGPVRWAARLSPQGHDVLTYAATVPSPAPPPVVLEPGELLVELWPAQMESVRVYLAMRERQGVVPAPGFEERVRAAHFDRAANRWLVPLNAAQVDSVAYALFLRSGTGMVGEANRFAREYGVIYTADKSTGRVHASRFPESRAVRRSRTGGD